MSNKRHFERVFFGTEVILEVEGQRYKEKLVDISLKGALISMDQPIPLSGIGECRLVIRLSDDVAMLFKTLPVHFEEKRMGLKFVEADTETLAHLRRLLELNTGDPEEIERELHFLVSDS
ncbi:MAG: PilZ domain-containing protein [Desulfuromonadales bacterium]|nr:PilZ domain-containing protein [Desulfuromonadales bacterium]